MAQVLTVEGENAVAVVDVGPFTVVVLVAPAAWHVIGANIYYATADCSGTAYIATNGDVPLLDYAATTGAPGAVELYAASRTSTASTITVLSSRHDGGSSCSSLNYGSVLVVPTTQVLSVASLGAAPYRIVRTP